MRGANGGGEDARVLTAKTEEESQRRKTQGAAAAGLGTCQQEGGGCPEAEGKGGHRGRSH